MFSYLYATPTKLDFKVSEVSAQPTGIAKDKRLCLVSDGSAKMSSAEATARWFSSAGWQVTWLDLSVNGSAPSGIEEASFSYEKLAGKFAETNWYGPMQSLCAYHWLKQQNFDVILFQHGFGAAYFSCVAKKTGLAFASTPLLALCDDPYAFWLEKGEFFPTFVRTDAELDYFERETVARADGVLFTNRDVLDWMQAANWPLGNDPKRLALLSEGAGKPLDEWLVAKSQQAPVEPVLSDKEVSVSVCVTSFNRAAYLRETLEAMLRQTYKDFEVIVDDTSSEPAVDHLRDEYKTIFSERGWTWVKGENHGLNASRNNAAKLARGTYLLFKDDDNISLNDEVELFARAAKYSNADIITCIIGKHYLSDDAATPAAKFPARPQSGIPLQPAAYIYNGPILANGMMFNAFGDANSLVRKSVFEALGGRSVEKTSFFEDWEFHARAAMAGYKFESLPESLFLYRVHANSSNQKDTARIFNGLVSVARLYAQHVPPYLYPLLLSASNYFVAWRNRKPTRFPDPHLFPHYADAIKVHPAMLTNNVENIPNVVMAVTEKYRTQAAATLASLLSSSNQKPNIYIISPPGTKALSDLESIADHFNVGLNFVSYVSSKEKQLPPSRYLDDAPQALFWQILLPELLPDLDKAIVLDPGVLVRHDLGKLWDFDMGSSLVAATLEEQYPFSVAGVREPINSYFNMTAMLVDLEKWRAHNITDQALTQLATYEKENDTKQLWAQSAINHAVAGRWVQVSPIWNWRDDCSIPPHYAPEDSKARLKKLKIDRTEFDIIRANPSICHFWGPVKPWSASTVASASTFGREFQIYLKFASALLAGHQSEQVKGAVDQPVLAKKRVGT